MDLGGDLDRRVWARAAEGLFDARRLTRPGTADDHKLERMQAACEIAAGIVPASRRRAQLRRFRRWAQRTVLSVAVLSALGGAWTIASDRLNPPPRTKVWRPVFDPLLAQAHARDPGGATVWGLRAFINAGRRCVVLGRVEGGRVGRRADGRFEELSAGAPPACLRRGQDTMLLVRKYGSTTGRRTLVYGVAARDVRVAIGRRPPGRELPVADDGTFVLAVAGADALVDAKAYITDRVGRVTVQALGVT